MAQAYPCPGSRKITETRERRLPVLTGDAKQLAIVTVGLPWR